MKILVAGWFSFEQMGATAGDLLACDVACQWIGKAGLLYDVALASPFKGGVDWKSIDPNNYSHVVFVCGPFGNGQPLTTFLSHFASCTLVGLDVSMLEPLDAWNPFDFLLERDSSVASRPDITFCSPQARVPVVGLVLVHPQMEYRERGMHEVANNALHRLLEAREVAVVPIDTRLDVNGTGLHSPAEVESLIACMDVVMTTRLHGTVLALKNGVPAVAVDPIAGGAKVLRQAEAIGWPVVFTADALCDEALQEAFDYCLSDQARTKAGECRKQAEKMVQEIRDIFTETLIRSKVKARK